MALRRTARIGDGWIGTGNTPEEVPPLMEKLARLRAKQAERLGSAYLTGRVGGDYESGSGGSAGGAAKGVQRYQALVKDGRQ